MNWTMTRWLGYGGLIPFIALALGAWLSADLATRQALVQANAFYGAVILSFLGAIHWGLLLGRHVSTDIDCGCAADNGQEQDDSPEKTRKKNEGTLALVFGVIPALLAWVFLSVLPMPVACQMLAVSLWAAWAMDKNIYGRTPALAQFIVLRTHLTLGASIGLIITSLAR